MLVSIFSKVLSMSLTASLIIPVVLLARLALRYSPKIFSYALWWVVLLRLLCPVSVSSAISLIPRGVSDAISSVRWETPDPEEKPPYSQITPEFTDIPAAAQPEQSRLPEVLSVIWIAGVAAFWLYSIRAYIRLRRKLSDAIPLRQNIFLSDHVPFPCVVGLLRQKIYLPATLSDAEQPYIIAHEQHHIRRGDPLIRFLAFTALSVHWFNALVWLSFRLLVRDMEMSCDEAVLDRLGPGIRSDYSQSLLNLAAGHPRVAWTPLNFGEADTGGRIKNILGWRRPGAWVVALAMVLSVTVSVCAVTDPVTLPDEIVQMQQPESTPVQEIPEDIPNIVLNDAQAGAVRAYLQAGSPADSEICAAEEVSILFGVEISPYTICYGHCGGELCLTITRDGTEETFITRDETLMGYLQHFYACSGAVDMRFSELPDTAHLHSSHHAEGCDVRLYRYHCELCDQEETAVVSYYCGCANCNMYWRQEAQEIDTHTDRRR